MQRRLGVRRNRREVRAGLQQAVGEGGTTRLIVRWQPYVMHVTIERPDRAWAGDPEAALELSRALARRLGVASPD